MLLTCQAIFGEERGAELSAFLERATGEPCPCRQGRVCPLLPANVVEPPCPRHPNPNPLLNTA